MPNNTPEVFTLFLCSSESQRVKERRVNQRVCKLLHRAHHRPWPISRRARDPLAPPNGLDTLNTEVASFAAARTMTSAAAQSGEQRLHPRILPLPGRTTSQTRSLLSCRSRRMSHRLEALQKIMTLRLQHFGYEEIVVHERPNVSSLAMETPKRPLLSSSFPRPSMERP